MLRMRISNEKYFLWNKMLPSLNLRMRKWNAEEDCFQSKNSRHLAGNLHLLLPPYLSPSCTICRDELNPNLASFPFLRHILLPRPPTTSRSLGLPLLHAVWLDGGKEVLHNFKMGLWSLETWALCQNMQPKVVRCTDVCLACLRSKKGPLIFTPHFCFLRHAISVISPPKQERHPTLALALSLSPRIKSV